MEKYFARFCFAPSTVVSKKEEAIESVISIHASVPHYKTGCELLRRQIQITKKIRPNLGFGWSLDFAQTTSNYSNDALYPGISIRILRRYVWIRDLSSCRYKSSLTRSLNIIGFITDQPKAESTSELPTMFLYADVKNDGPKNNEHQFPVYMNSVRYHVCRTFSGFRKKCPANIDECIVTRQCQIDSPTNF